MLKLVLELVDRAGLLLLFFKELLTLGAKKIDFLRRLLKRSAEPFVVSTKLFVLLAKSGEFRRRDLSVRAHAA